MSLRTWGRAPDPIPDPLPDLHPAQIDLLAERDRITAAVAQVDAGLTRAGNARPTMRDRLLDIRLTLTQVTP